MDGERGQGSRHQGQIKKVESSSDQALLQINGNQNLLRPQSNQNLLEVSPMPVLMPNTPQRPIHQESENVIMTSQFMADSHHNGQGVQHLQ